MQQKMTIGLNSYTIKTLYTIYEISDKWYDYFTNKYIVI